VGAPAGGDSPPRRRAPDARRGSLRYDDPVARITIAGCGEVGSALGVALVADGHRVVGIRRRIAALPPNIAPVAADLVSGEGLASALPGTEVLVYAAAADGFSDAAYRAAYVVGLRNVLDGLRACRAPVRRVLFTSSTAVYAQDDGSWVDEASPTEPTGFSGRRLLEAERLLLAAGFPATVVRLAGIYGPGRTRLIDEVRSGAATCADGPPQYANRIHIADCAGALRHLIDRPDADGVWLGVDCEPGDRSAVLDWLADRMGVPRPRRVRTAGAQGSGVDRSAAAGSPRRPRGGNKRCRNAKLVASGYAFRYETFREGYGEMLAATPR
jgi:nucleoside-diphosphate-sugar epimerase